MILTELRLENFRNCERLNLQFSGKFNCFTGRNGAGKTNLLDGVYYICTGKSWFNSLDAQLIKDEEGYFSLRGRFEKAGEAIDILAVQIRGRKKVIKKNDVPYERLVEHYGAFPVVMIAPGDMELIGGGSEERRRWMDATISMVDTAYLLNLMRYDKILQQRNAELKKMARLGEVNREVLDILDQMMAPLALAIYERRDAFIREFLPFFQIYHDRISGEEEKVALIYKTKMGETSLLQLLADCFRQDMALQRTNQGTHKDDLEFTIFGKPLKKFGSQGQQKTFLFALKLAQHQYLREKTGFKPILLLDDVCERLDEYRLSRLMSLISGEGFGQIFITDTSRARLEAHLPERAGELKYFDIE